MKKHRLMNHQKYFRTLCFGLSFLSAACTNESPLNTEPAEWPKTSISIQATVDTKAANEPETAADNGTITRAGGDKQVPAAIVCAANWKFIRKQQTCAWHKPSYL